ncbi:MAG: hypothetical protein HY645_11195 [Acidobacteria bacterium]|nr:hypothetical protein [Acidobacteriota bacterium]
MSSKPAENTTLFVAVAWGGLEKIGHQIPYHCSLMEACRRNHWDFELLTSGPCSDAMLSRSVKAILPPGPPASPYTSHSWFSRLENTVEFSKILRNEIRDRLPQYSHVIVFCEQFNWRWLLPLRCAFVGIDPAHVSLGLLSRYDITVHARKIQVLKVARTAALHFILVQLLRRKIKKKLQIFADTIPLQKLALRLYRQPVYVLPIPHTRMLGSRQQFVKQNDGIRFWWPAFYPAEEKGLTLIRKWVRDAAENPSQHVEVFVPETAQLLESSLNVKVNYLPRFLERQDYLRMFQNVDVILLPFREDKYKRASSGIFVESIVHNRPVLTTAASWMGSELKRFGMEEWCFDPRERKDFNQIVSAALSVNEDDPRRQKLVAHFREFHNEERFAGILLNAFTPPMPQ